MIASWRGHLKIVKVLLGAGAETDVQDQVCNVLCSKWCALICGWLICEIVCMCVCVCVCVHMCTYVYACGGCLRGEKGVLVPYTLNW